MKLLQRVCVQQGRLPRLVRTAATWHMRMRLDMSCPHMPQHLTAQLTPPNMWPLALSTMQRSPQPRPSMRIMHQHQRLRPMRMHQ